MGAVKVPNWVTVSIRTFGMLLANTDPPPSATERVYRPITEYRPSLSPNELIEIVPLKLGSGEEN
jgi:hypothetical protein